MSCSLHLTCGVLDTIPITSSTGSYYQLCNIHTPPTSYHYLPPLHTPLPPLHSHTQDAITHNASSIPPHSHSIPYINLYYLYNIHAPLHMMLLPIMQTPYHHTPTPTPTQPLLPQQPPTTPTQDAITHNAILRPCG